MNINYFPPSLLPVGTPSTTPPKPLVSQRSLACKLSLSIPTTSPSLSIGSTPSVSSNTTVNCGQTPAPLKVASTPLRQSRPKLSLNVSSSTSQQKPSLSLSTSVLPPVRQPTPESEEGDVTARNTVANQRLTAESCVGLSNNMDVDEVQQSYTFDPIPGVKPILKRGIRSGSSSSASSASSLNTMDYSMSSSITSVSSTFSLSKSVSFDMCPSYIPRSYIEEEDDDELMFDDVENMSPPSTTSSTDSEESESDNEVKTPVDNTQSGWMTRKFANKPGFGGGGRWKRAKREWVWTLGDCNTDVEQHQQGIGYSNGEPTKVWVAV